MKKFTIVLSTTIIMLMLLTSLTTAQKPEKDAIPLLGASHPAVVYEAIHAARLRGDIETALTYYADNAVFIAFPPPPGSDGIFVGKDAIQAIMEELYARNLTYTYTDFQAHGNKAAVTVQSSEDVFSALGFESLTFNGTSILDNGVVMLETWMMGEESQARFFAALALAENEALFNRFIEELWHENNFAVADEILSEDFVSHVFPAGDSEALIEAIQGFRTDLPEGYFIIDDLTVTAAKIVAQGSVVAAPPAQGDEPERLDRFILTLGVTDGKISDRWVAFVP